jgi:hypothetical protein
MVMVLLGGAMTAATSGSLVAHQFWSVARIHGWRPVHRCAILIGSEPPLNDSVWNAASRKGFEVLSFTRGIKAEGKKVDTEIVARATEIICDHLCKGAVVLASGIKIYRVVHRRSWAVECAPSQTRLFLRAEWL